VFVQRSGAETKNNAGNAQDAFMVGNELKKTNADERKKYIVVLYIVRKTNGALYKCV